MEDRNYNNQDWYRPASAETEEVVTDLFEEVGLYKVKTRDELLEQNRPKKRKWGWLIALLVVGLLVAAIVISAKLFGGEEDGYVADAQDFFDAYSEFYDQYTEQNGSDSGSGEYPMERAETNPNLELKLSNAVGDEAMTLQELYVECMPSVVGIVTYERGSKYAWGTGVIMTSDGYIITNAHIVDGAEAVDVLLHDGTQYPAKLVGADAISDIALLKVDAKKLPAAEFVDSALVQVGDEAIAIGNPLSEEFSWSMSTGIISGMSRSVSYMNRDMSLLQTDAALNNGNSGGALFNIYGQVVGITNMKMMGNFTATIEGVGFAIPSATVKEMVDAILDDGAVVGRPGLGITVYNVADLGDMDSYMGDGLDYPSNGMLINSVVKGSDAEKKGLQVNDIVIGIDGKTVDGINVIRDVIKQKHVGDTVTLEVWRAGEILSMEIALIDQNDF